MFTSSGAGTLVRRGLKINSISKVSDFKDLELLKRTLTREREALDARQTAERYVDFLGKREFTAFYDEGMEGLAVILQSSAESKSPQLPQLSTLTLSKSAWLTSLSDNLFDKIRDHFPQLIWTVRQDDENLSWFFGKADGSLTRDGEVLFWYGLEDGNDVRDLVIEFNQNGRDMFGDTSLDTKFAKAARKAGDILAGAGANFTQRRQYSTSRNVVSPTRPARRSMAVLPLYPSPSSTRSYATQTTTNPNPPFGVKNASNKVPSKVALIGT